MSKFIDISKSFCRMEAYDASVLNCHAFRRGTDERNGIVLSLGNMVSGYPFEIEGIRFENSERAFIAGMFSLGTEPLVGYALLEDAHIILLGKELTFNQYVKAA